MNPILRTPLATASRESVSKAEPSPSARARRPSPGPLRRVGAGSAYAISGREGEGEGDTLEAPTATYEVDLWAYVRDGRPTSARTHSREVHADPGTRWVEQWSYADGFGNLAQTKARAEAGLAPVRDEAGSLVLGADGQPTLVQVSERWVGSGRTIRNNKGLPIKQYEPFFSDRADYEDEAVLVETGVTPIVHYDPMGRTVRTELPDGTLARVEFSPWLVRSYDPGDTVLESAWHAARVGGEFGAQAQRAAERSEVYADTPSTAVLDHLGRAFLQREHNRWVGPDTGDVSETFPETRAVLDVEGTVLRVVDARGNVAQENTYGPGGGTLRTQSVDAGSRWALSAVDGTPLRSWNSRGVRSWGRFDALRRPTHAFVQEPEAGTRLVTRTVYGESLPDPEATYHRGRAYRVYDGAGVQTAVAHDFSGNVLAQTRVLAAAFEETVDWSALAEIEDVVDLENAAAALLETEVFETSGAFDALGRSVSQRSPDGTELNYGYNDAALLESVTGRIRGANEVTAFVSNVDYNARGQRTLVAYGNGTQTTYTYDPQTYRLQQLQTQGGGQTYQDLRYWFDAAGNIVEQQDGAQQATYFDNAVVEPGQRFAYDAQSRLVWASGREHRSLSQPTHESFGSVSHREDGAAMRRYTQRYVYDVVGNILRMQHAADGGDWTRRYVYAEDGNRLLANSGPEDAGDQHSHTYGYDVHGNMTSMRHLSEVQWDFADRMQSADLGGGGTAYFVYDAAGERVRKVRVNEGGGRSFERIYVGGFEVYRERVGGTVRLERESVHVGDDVGRMCLLETQTVRDGEAVGEPQTVQRYQYGNHLGSAALELTEDREVISYEEYHPYGTSSYRAANSGVDVSERRYRYTGKERDEETGLGYHGARYYACWLGRWTASDPIGLGDGVNRYAYVRGSPISLRDPSGTKGADPDEAQPLNSDIETAKSELVGIDLAEAAPGSDKARQAAEAVEILRELQGIETSAAAATVPEAWRGGGRRVRDWDAYGDELVEARDSKAGSAAKGAAVLYIGAGAAVVTGGAAAGLVGSTALGAGGTMGALAGGTVGALGGAAGGAVTDAGLELLNQSETGSYHTGRVVAATVRGGAIGGALGLVFGAAAGARAPNRVPPSETPRTTTAPSGAGKSTNPNGIPRTTSAAGPGQASTTPSGTGATSAAERGASVGAGKWDYIFGQAKGTKNAAHNAPRTQQNVEQMRRLGVHNTEQGRKILQDHFDEVVQDPSNVIRNESNKWGTFETRESLFVGPGGSAKFETTWEVMANGARRLTTIIPRGRGPL